MEKKKWNKETEENITGVVNSKSAWHAAHDDGDEDGMQEASEKAKAYYKSLADTGNYDIVKELQASDYDRARGYLENYKINKPADTNRGMVQENTRTATDTVKKQSDFASRSENAIFEGYENQEERINANPLDSDAAKAIMDRYRGLGDNAKDEVVADGSVRNDGNMDSFAKAQGDAQRVAYEQAGIDSVFDLHSRNVEAGGQNYRDLQSGIGVAGNQYNSAIANANDTSTNATNNENVNRQSDAEITGKVPEVVARENNPYFNEDGTVNEVYLTKEFDASGGFQSIINDAIARGDMETVREAEEARAWKINNVQGYEEYAPTVKAPSVQKTEAGRQFDESVRLSEEENNLAKHEIDTEATITREKTAAELYAEAMQYEVLGMTEVAESMRKYADNMTSTGDEVIKEKDEQTDE